MLKESLNEPHRFWEQPANELHWFKKWDTVLHSASDEEYTWFKGGLTNVCYNALDHHVNQGRADQVALIYDSPVLGIKKKYTYRELLGEVERCAGAFASLGVAKGDMVVIYMPMVPQAVVAMLACARLGAIHSVVFGGFASDQLAQRIDHAHPKLVVSASCGLVGPKAIPYKPLLDEAIAMAKHKPQHCVILNRDPIRCELTPGRDLDWDSLVKSAKPAPCVPVESSHPLYVLYTSGTTGQPKGIVRDSGGNMVALKWSMSHVFGIHPGEVWFAASDIGWVLGHSYIVYGPLLQGATTILYEGKPVGTPDAGAFFRMISEYGVKCFFTAPTAFRAIKKEDPEGHLLSKFDLKSFHALFLAGERSDPDTLSWAESHLNVPVVDNYWQTETGWPVAANPLGIGDTRFPSKHGSASKVVPGWNVSIVNAEGHRVKPNELGTILLKLPLPPGSLMTLFKAPERFKKAYLSDFPGYYLTGDAGYFDEDGNLHVMTRIDDIINVSGVRLSTGAMEEILSAHPAVAECAVVGVSDEFRGEVPIGFIVLKSNVKKEPKAIYDECVEMVRSRIGAVAFFKKVAVVPALPKTRSGKVLRVCLRNIAEGRAANPPGTIEDVVALEYAREAIASMGYPLKK